ncbi:HEAT repeat domain-containing protein [Nocardia sp. NPDC005998]|uniref:HEAT repeat domain-containing protein n=1 Tax=Nocardia sp. NPDC005998 TaxID=3156894 RepID=UPI0033BE49F5
MSTYQRLDPIERSEAIAQLESSESQVVAETILRLALHDPDAGWVTDRALALLESSDYSVRASAATALGHIARIHRSIDSSRVVPALQRLLNDPATAGRADDALDDIAVFAPSSGAGPA